MPLPLGILQREFDKFRQSPGDRVAVAFVDAEKFEINDVDKVGSTLYYGEENVDSVWRIRKVVKSGSGSNSTTSIRYASVRGNQSYSTYNDAWTNRTSLTYDTYSTSI